MSADRISPDILNIQSAAADSFTTVVPEMPSLSSVPPIDGLVDHINLEHINEIASGILGSIGIILGYGIVIYFGAKGLANNVKV